MMRNERKLWIFYLVIFASLFFLWLKNNVIRPTFDFTWVQCRRDSSQHFDFLWRKFSQNLIPIHKQSKSKWMSDIFHTLLLYSMKCILITIGASSCQRMMQNPFHILRINFVAVFPLSSSEFPFHSKEQTTEANEDDWKSGSVVNFRPQNASLKQLTTSRRWPLVSPFTEEGCDVSDSRRHQWGLPDAPSDDSDTWTSFEEVAE